MSNIKDRRDVARLTVRGREFRIERIVWKDSTGLSFDVYDAATDQCLTAESFDNQPREGDVATLLDQIKDDLEGGTLDRFFDDDETKATLADILASADLRALADRPRPVVGLDTRTDPAFSIDPVTRAASDHADEAARRYGVLEAAKVADAIARVFPGAHRVVFEVREKDNGDTICDLWTVRDANNVLLWYDVDFAHTPDAAAQAWEEAHGGPVHPNLDLSTHIAIEAQLEAAYDASTSWTTWAGAAGEDLADVGDTYSGELEVLIVPEVIAEAKRLTSGGPAVRFDKNAFRDWCRAPHSSGEGTNRTQLLGGRYASDSDEASALAEDALSYVVDVPQVWAYGDGVTDVTIYRTTDNDGADGGCAVEFTIDGIALSAGHLQAGDLVPRESVSGAGAALLALTAIAAAVNRAAARFHAATGRTDAVDETVKPADVPADDVPQLRGGEVWGPVTLGFDGLGGDTWRAVYEPAEHWNGWLCPRFRRAEAELMRLYFEAGAARNPEMTEMDTLRWDGDVLVLVSGQYNRDGGMLEPGQEPDEDRIEPDERGLYPIGSHSWCWMAARDEPAAAGDA